MPEKFSVQAYPGADRIARGEEWLQTNTLDGQHPHDSFIRIGEPSYFQEYGPAGYHVAIGFANPAIINARHNDVCNGFGTPGSVGPCTNTITGQVDVERISRTPDQRLYASETRDALAWTQCWVSLGDPDGEDFMFTKCDALGNFSFSNVPGGNWRLTIGDQWNDQIIDGLSTPANVGCTSAAPNGSNNAITCPGGKTLALGSIGVQQWQSNLYTRTFIDDNKNGIWDNNEIGIPLIYTMVHFRDGHNSNVLNTDFNGIANFNETYPLFNWYVVEADSGRYKTTGIHTVYDAGGPADGSTSCGTSNGARACGTSTAYKYLSNTYESVPLPADLSVPGAVYCKTADCTTEANASFVNATPVPSFAGASTGRIDPPWVGMEAWAGLTGLSNWIDFGKAPYASCPPACVTATGTVSTTPSATAVSYAENGGIHGYVDYASTRPFDDASQMIEQPWEPNVPRVTINLYQEGFASDGTPTLTWVDTTQSASWDDWAQGFYPGATSGSGTGAGSRPYMNCPGQGTATGTNADLFYFTLFDQPNFLDWYHNTFDGTTAHTLPYNSQYKCYDSMHIANQIQPASYDGRYSFPSSLGVQVTGASAGKPLATKGSTNGVASSMAGTNCTICVPNPDSTDKWRSGTPMLPAGKYVVQAIMPPGYEVYKEEDKNLLIGDNFIAPVTQQFGGLGADIFIVPDQASVASMYDPSAAGYNPTNYQDATTALGLNEELSGVPGFPGFQDPIWPCVGERRVVPDYLSLFPQAKEAGPFAGATRPLCDRKEVTLANQMSVSAKFYIFTSTHIASKFTGGITDDFTSEFDPFSPQFGEKFAPPNLPVSTKDYLGNEISRVYSDHWGTYDGLTYSSWEVNPPNITGYSPTIMVQCMNDPGPILDTNASSPTYGQMITDPLYNAAYSNFCYENPYMPGLTTYLDTPVVPTTAFVGAGYNNVDCAYPDATPAIKEVDTQDGIGPWASAFGHTITITSLGVQQVNNSAYAGPSASVAPFNLKTIARNYGFGSTAGTVTVGGVPLANVNWTNNTITGTLQLSANLNGTSVQVQPCSIPQQSIYKGSEAEALCGQLLITAANGQQSIDTVTVTIRGKMPVHVGANQSVQAAIDAANPGDMIMIDPTCMTVATTTTPAQSATCSSTALHPTTGAASQTASTGSHNEMLIMWKPVRLQGVGAASSIINASAFPAGKLLDPWRRHINCFFGLSLQGSPVTTASGAGSYDPAGVYSCPDTDNGVAWNAWVGAPNSPQIDRMPLEAVIGWDATQNGNLAEQLQEPSLMGAFEGAGITVLAKGVDYHGAVPWTDGNEPGAFPAGTTLLTGVGPNPTLLPVGDANPFCLDATTGTTNPFPSNFMCNPSSIDGLTVTSSSQGGGGIFAHGWAHHLQIANNRVYNNAGTLTGGIGIGQGEFPTPYVLGSTTNAAPGSCSDGTNFVTNQHLPYCLQIAVNVHNNMVTTNSSLGDELFSGTLSGGGGVTFCTGNDYYKFNNNWVCGNLSAGEGGGLVHLGEIQNGDIEHNSFVLNQSQNPTIPTNGGAIHVQGTPDTDPVCGTSTDADCPPGLSDGSGHGLVINANLIQGNMSESGSGGGIRLQQVNGTEVSMFPTQPQYWNDVTITNNIIVNNEAGWDGAGISLQDALKVQIVNNTIAHNDTLATSGVLTQSVGTPDSSAPAGSCLMTGPTGSFTASCPQSSGVTSTANSSLLTTTFTGLSLTCPFNLTGCAGFSNPLLLNNVIAQNRSFHVGIAQTVGSGNQNQQNVVALYNGGFNGGTSSPAGTQASTGACSTSDTYWDLGVRGDAGPNNHGPFTITNTSAQHNFTTNTGNPHFASQYCNGARVPPECTVGDGCGGPTGYGVPPGIVDASAPNPVFSLNPNATVDEGNNWINVSWGPLALANPSATGADGNYAGGPPLGNYTLTAGSPAIDFVPTNETVPSGATVPPLDFFGNPRPEPGNDSHFDPGAAEFQGATGTGGGPTITRFSPASGVRGATVNPVTITGTNLAGATVTVSLPTGVTGINGVTASTPTGNSGTSFTTSFTINRTATLGSRTVTVTTMGGSATTTFTVTGAMLTFSAPNPALTTTTANTTTKTGTISVLNVAGPNGAPFTFTAAPSIAKMGTAGGAFSIVTGTGGGTCGNGFVLNSGSSCTIVVQYAPGTSTATGTANITVTGSGLATTTQVDTITGN